MSTDDKLRQAASAALAWFGEYDGSIGGVARMREAREIVDKLRSGLRCSYVTDRGWIRNARCTRLGTHGSGATAVCDEHAPKEDPAAVAVYGAFDKERAIQGISRDMARELQARMPTRSQALGLCADVLAAGSVLASGQGRVLSSGDPLQVFGPKYSVRAADECEMRKRALVAWNRNRDHGFDDRSHAMVCSGPDGDGRFRISCDCGSSGDITYGGIRDVENSTSKCSACGRRGVLPDYAKCLCGGVVREMPGHPAGDVA